MPAQDREVEVPVCGASHPLAYGNACHAVRVCDLVNVDAAPDRRDCGVDVLYVVGLPWQSVARQDSFPRATQPAACQKHVQVAESSGRLESSRYRRSSQAQIGAAAPAAALAGQNRVVATRQGLPILARLDCKYVSHHVPLDGPGVGTLRLVRGRLFVHRETAQTSLPVTDVDPISRQVGSHGHHRNLTTGSRTPPPPTRGHQPSAPPGQSMTPLTATQDHPG